MNIEWNKVTHISQVVALVLFVGIFFLGLFLGKQVGVKDVLGYKTSDEFFKCAEDKTIRAVFYENGVHIALSEGRQLFLTQIASMLGSRYGKSGEPVVFWNRQDTAFVTEGDSNVQVYKNCISNIPTASSTPVEMQ